MKLYHTTTPKKLERYSQSRCIIKPVRGFLNYEAAEYWARRHNRSIILELDCERDKAHKLPDHHNKHGEAWWCDCDIWEYEILKKNLIPNTPTDEEVEQQIAEELSGHDRVATLGETNE